MKFKKNIKISSERSQTALKMENTQQIKLFETMQTNLINLGFIPNQKMPFNVQHTRGCIIGFLAIVLHFAFLVYEADTVKQCMDSIFMITVGIAMLTSFVSTVFKTETLFIVIDGLQEIVNKREF